MKTIKAWAVVDRDGDVVVDDGYSQHQIFKRRDEADDWRRAGERVARVTITVEDEK